MKYLFVTQHKKTWPIDLMCRVLGVTRQGYYHYRRNTEARLADPEHQEMLGWVKDIAIASKYSYGYLVAQAKGRFNPLILADLSDAATQA